ncbi:Magnesium transporter NIPA [Penicillium expansum]|uniref:Magnesium transporter NIPA n=1 Tax=Penicillium expansum TaxID=27334 RepID=A0A0A2K7J4_PENEN|nr:Magnesium transporter NIPA [Penicillium expansum]KGO45660.1 Magnesium transporter NIPA [Penicillium expansum]KGO52047.1 Magnesium transporter NIPA [Penicillium expansum]KGO62841.1 Magnesium transporter NIPA [Penicillium expansum]
MASSQSSLVASLLPGLLSSAVSPSRSSTFAASSIHQLFVPPSNSTSGTPHDHDGGNGGNMHEWSSLIGIITALCGNVLISLALNIQRYAHIRITREWEQDKNRNGEYGNNGTRAGSRGRSQAQYRDSDQDDFEPYRDDDGDDTEGRNTGSSSRATSTGSKDGAYGNRKSYLKSPYWWAGIMLMVVGEMGNFMAYGFAPASIVSPLGVVALISNCIIAPCLLKEKFRKRDLWGVLVSIAGAVVVVLSAKSSEEQIGPDEIWANITRWEFLLYLGLTTSLIIGLMWASHPYGSRSILIDVGLVALFGGYTALSTKGVSSLLSGTLWHVITFPITYLLVFVLVASALMQIRYINRALQRFDSTQVIPTQFVLFTLAVIIGSGVLYRDFESITTERATKFVGGCVLTFLGVSFITSGRVRADDESSFSSEDEEGSIGLVNGERYHDGIDLSPPGHQLPKASDVSREAPYDVPQSPRGSILSQAIDGVDDDQSTPRGILSAAPSSPHGSLIGASPLSAPSFDFTSPLRPPSRMSNPWADIQDQAVVTQQSDIRPVTPPAHEDETPQASTVLLRFPPAPGIEETAGANGNAGTGTVRRASTPTLLDQASHPVRNEATLETPSRRALRNSISHRFSPGPLLPTLSGGFTAVVADSIRRGDGSPLKDRTRRRLGRRRHLDGAFADPSLEGNSDAALSLATARLQSATNLSDSPAEAGHSTSAVPPVINTVPAPLTNEDATRLRSLSDSWSGGLAWLGGALRKTQSSIAAAGMPTPENETQLEPSHNAGDSEIETESRR